MCLVQVRVLGTGACNTSLVVTAAARPARWGRDREQQPAPEGADLVLSTPWAQVPQPPPRPPPLVLIGHAASDTPY